MNPVQAMDAICAVVVAAWQGSGYPLLFEGMPAPSVLSAAPWGRVTIRHAEGAQSSLAGADNARRYTLRGTVFVQVFAPLGAGKAQAYQLAQTVLAAYTGVRSSDVWYYRPRLEDVGSDGKVLQVNALIDFSYDDVRL